MGVVMEGGCVRCNSFMTKHVNAIESLNTKMICDSCYDNFFSPYSIRAKKLRFLTKKWYEFWITL